MKHKHLVLSSDLIKVELRPHFTERFGKSDLSSVCPASERIVEGLTPRNVSFPNVSRWLFDLY